MFHFKSFATLIVDWSIWSFSSLCSLEANLINLTGKWWWDWEMKAICECARYLITEGLIYSDPKQRPVNCVFAHSNRLQKRLETGGRIKASYFKRGFCTVHNNNNTHKAEFVWTRCIESWQHTGKICFGRQHRQVSQNSKYKWPRYKEMTRWK